MNKTIKPKVSIGLPVYNGENFLIKRMNLEPLNLAIKYMEIFYDGGDFEELREYLADDLVFEGPFYFYDNANEYIDAMQADPPKGFVYELLRQYEVATSACLIYKFSKPGVSTIMVQTFQIDLKNKISRILLVFDTAQFK